MVDIFAMEEQFTGDYKKAFSKIAVYGTLSPIDSEKYDDRVLNIYDMLIEAQAEGRPVEKIVGGDIEAFCKEYYKSHHKLEWLGNGLKRIFVLMAITFVYSLLEFFVRNENQVNGSPILVGAIVGVVTICIQKIAQIKLLFKTDKIKSLAYSMGILIIFAICIAVGVSVFNDSEIYIPFLPTVVITGSYCGIYLICRMVIRYKKSGSFRDPDRAIKRQQKAYLKEITLEQDIKTSAVEMEKRFRKINTKLEKKGKESMTFEKFAQKIRADHKFTRVLEVILLVAIVLIAVVNTVLGINDEDFIIRVVAIAISTGISFAIYKIGMDAIKEVEVAQCHILDECQEKAIDIEQYVAKMANLENNG
ncbi:MAG: hypothetical protein IJV71_03600 [Lachnospiraceae bacterium]|nr:hypothetical protein [Lachnospiraceae bacterium]